MRRESDVDGQAENKGYGFTILEGLLARDRTPQETALRTKPSPPELSESVWHTLGQCLDPDVITATGLTREGLQKLMEMCACS